MMSDSGRPGAVRRERLVPEHAARRARGLIRAATSRGQASGRGLSEREGKAILALYGIRTPRELLAGSSEDAVLAAEQIGYPVTLKAESPYLIHTSETGTIIPDVADVTMLRSRFKRALTNAWSWSPADSVVGVLIQETVPSGTNAIVGVMRDPREQPVVVCELPGEAAEGGQTAKDVQLLEPPFDAAEAHRALSQLHGYPRLAGADTDALVDVLLRFSELALDLGDLVHEIGVNPLIVAGPGRGACAVDCLVVVGE
ncbi:MAG: acetate--CoA ligase family protein [Chloroflexota bacterium]